MLCDIVHSGCYQLLHNPPMHIYQVSYFLTVEVFLVELLDLELKRSFFLLRFLLCFQLLSSLFLSSTDIPFPTIIINTI